MALTKGQADAVTNLFSSLFAKNSSEEDRKKLFIEFEDVYTYKTEEAYQIYKHLGFQESKMVQMKKYIV